MKITIEDIKPFAELLEAAQLAELIRLDYDCESNRRNVKTSIKMGSKFARVDVGSSGKYMVDLASGEIWGIKGYGVVHRGHNFGTLATIGEWDWSGYCGRRLAVETGATT